MPAMPPIVDRDTWQEQVAELLREKAHTREGDAIAAARRRLPMVEVDPSTPLIGASGEVTLLDAFEGRTQLFASYHMWHTGRPAADQCEGCTFNTGHVLELGYLHSRDVTFAVFCEGPFEESNRYREFMGWEMPWYSVPEDSRGRAHRRAALRHEGVLPARRRPRLRDVLDHRARLRDDGQLLRDARHDRLRPPGVLGGLARGLAAAFFAPSRAERTTSDARAVNPPDGRPSRSGRGSPPAAPTTSAPP